MATHIVDGVYRCICHESRRDERKGRGRPEKCLHQLFQQSHIMTDATQCSIVRRGRPPIPLPSVDEMMSRYPNFNPQAPKLGRPRKIRELYQPSCEEISDEESNSSSNSTEEETPDIILIPVEEVIDLTDEQDSLFLMPQTPTSPNSIATQASMRNIMENFEHSLRETSNQDFPIQMSPYPNLNSISSQQIFSPNVPSSPATIQTRNTIETILQNYLHEEEDEESSSSIYVIPNSVEEPLQIENMPNTPSFENIFSV